MASTDLINAGWQNLVLRNGDEEIRRIDEKERRAAPVPAVAGLIRELITRFEICHFKAERHVDRILGAIGEMRLDFAPATIGQAHPRCGEEAWRKDASGRSRQGQEYLWAMQSWLAGEPGEHPQGFPQAQLDEVSWALGLREPRKCRLVNAVMDRLRLTPDRPPLPPELGPFWEQVEAIDICHYDFPANLHRLLEGIGRLEPVRDFAGCGSCDAARRSMAATRFSALCGWLRRQPGTVDRLLGDRTPVKEWLVACLAKTLKEQAGLAERLD